MSKLNALLRTLSGKNKTGQLIYGVLDVLPIPAFHNIIRTAISDKIEPIKMPSYVWQRLDKLRLSTSIIMIGLAIATANGYIDEETLKMIIEYIKIIS